MRVAHITVKMIPSVIRPSSPIILFRGWNGFLAQEPLSLLAEVVDRFEKRAPALRIVQGFGVKLIRFIHLTQLDSGPSRMKKKSKALPPPPS